MKIAFWSPHRNMGTTACMLAVSAATAWKMNKSCLLIQTGLHQKDLESLLASKVTENEQSIIARELGTDALIRRFKAAAIRGEDVVNCSVEAGGGLSYLPSAGNSAADDTVISGVMNRILDAAKDRFDVIMTDVGTEVSNIGLEMIKRSDITVAVCGQNKEDIESAAALAKEHDIPEDRIFLMFSKYLRTSKYNISNLKHFFWIIGNKNSGTVPLCPSYMDALTDRKAVLFLKCLEGNEDDAEDPFFYSEVVKCARKLLEMGKRIERRR